jgi:GNAT superfamily N-acetyltransferase
VSSVSSSDPAAGAGAALRSASADDAERLAALICAAYEVERQFVRGDRIDAASVREHLAKGAFLILPADPDAAASELDGCVYVEPRGEIGYLGLLSVAPGRQGRGLGDFMLRAGEAWLERRGCREVEIRVVDQRVELFPWYCKRGYLVSGGAPFVDVGRLLRPCRFVLMRKPLAAGDYDEGAPSFGAADGHVGAAVRAASTSSGSSSASSAAPYSSRAPPGQSTTTRDSRSPASSGRARIGSEDDR